MRGITKFLHGKPWLKLINTNNITNRLLQETKGNAFIVYNLLQQSYELHTKEAYYLSGDSYNCSLDRELLTQFLIWDYKANDFANHLNDILSIKEEYELIKNKREKLKEDLLSQNTTTSLERILGTHV